MVNWEFFSKIKAVGQFNAGQSNPTFIIESNEGRRYVLRKKPPGKAFALCSCSR